MRKVAVALGLGVAACLISIASISLSRGMETVAPFWPVNALALVLMLRTSRSAVDDLVLAGSLVAATAAGNLIGGSPLAVAGGFASLNGAEVLLSAALARRFASTRFRSTTEGWRFFFVVGPPAPLLGALTVALAAYMSGRSDWLAAGLTWFCADLFGFILIGPLGMTISGREIARLQITRRGLEAGLLFSLVVGATLVVFSQDSLPLLFVVAPFVLLATFRFRLIGANVATLIVAAIAIPLTNRGLGPLALIHLPIPGIKLLVLQLFLAVNGLTAVPLASALAERDYHLRKGADREDELRRKNWALEQAAHVAAIADDIAESGHFSLRMPDGEQHWSPGVFRIFGFDQHASPPPVEEVVSRYRPDEREDLRSKVQHAIATGEGFSWECEIIRPDGARWIRLKAQVATSGGETLLLGAVRDVTRERQAKEALAERERSFRLLAENATDIIARFDLDARFTYLSPSVKTILGYEPEELLGLSTASIMHPDDYVRSLEVYRDHLEAGAPASGFNFEYRAFRKTGEMIWLSGHPRAVRNPLTDALDNFQDVVRDVTERVELVDALRNARDEAQVAVQAKSEFLANMSHELRTPLTSVLGYTDLLREHVKEAPAADYLARIGDGGSTLLSTVNDILDFSKLDAGQIEIKTAPNSPLEIARAVTGLLQTQADAKGIALNLTATGDASAAVWMDGTRTRQVLTNLVGNAIKFTETGSVELSVHAEANRLRFQVVDTGPGIPEDLFARLFQRFSQIDGSTTRNHGGAGLGLAISKGLVEAMGGSVGVDSVVGRGSTFWFELPAAPVPKLENANDDALEASSTCLSGIRLLVVDDNAANRELIRILASTVDMEVSEAPSGEAALELAAGQPFDIVLMDISMPGMGGPTAAKAIRSQPGPNDGIPILAFTAFTPGAVPRDVDLSPFDGVITKPVSAANLFSSLAAALEGETIDTRQEAADG